MVTFKNNLTEQRLGFVPLATSLYAPSFEVLFIKILLLINDFGVPPF